jgi:hypothetical protein
MPGRQLWTTRHGLLYLNFANPVAGSACCLFASRHAPTGPSAVPLGSSVALIAAPYGRCAFFSPAACVVAGPLAGGCLCFSWQAQEAAVCKCGGIV